MCYLSKLVDQILNYCDCFDLNERTIECPTGAFSAIKCTILSTVPSDLDTKLALAAVIAIEHYTQVDDSTVQCQHIDDINRLLQELQNTMRITKLDDDLLQLEVNNKIYYVCYSCYSISSLL